MKNDSTLLGPLLRKFFLDFLCTQRRASPETVTSYRDTFRLLLQFVKSTYGIEPVSLRVSDLSIEVILAFLNYLEQSRGNSARSRNLRLAAIRTFFRVVALYDPASVSHATAVLALPSKRCDKKLIHFLSRDEVDALLSSIDLSQLSGRRDHALLLTLYNSGARASEIITLKRLQVSFGSANFLTLHGKGRKERTIPLWSRTATTLRDWFSEIERHTALAFPNNTHQQLTRNGLDYILQRAVKQAAHKCPSLLDRHVTPHVFRHTTATHLLQSGVDIATIALWLGHERIDTTHIYLECDLSTKVRALSKLAPAGSDVPLFEADDEVLAFLASIDYAK